MKKVTKSAEIVINKVRELSIHYGQLDSLKTTQNPAYGEESIANLNVTIKMMDKVFAQFEVCTEILVNMGYNMTDLHETIYGKFEGESLGWTRGHGRIENLGRW